MANWVVHTLVIQAPEDECARALDAYAEQFDHLPWDVYTTAIDHSSTEIRYHMKYAPDLEPAAILSYITPEFPVVVQWEELMMAIAGVATFLNGECTQYEDKSEALRTALWALEQRS